MKKFLLFSFFPLLLNIAFAQKTSNTCELNGTKWYFDSDYETGEFANGDPWVVGPINITAITPSSSENKHGSTLNPQRGSTQGFDDRVSAYNEYDSDIDISKLLPINILPNSSIVSSISNIKASQYEQIAEYNILTVLANAPPEGSFRPAPIGGDYTVPWNLSDIHYNALANLKNSVKTIGIEQSQ